MKTKTWILTASLFLGLTNSAFADDVKEEQSVFCQKAIDDPEAFSIAHLVVPGAELEYVTICGSYKGGDGVGGEARGNWFNWYFVRTRETEPEKVLKIYLHHVETHTLRMNKEGAMRLAYANQDETGMRNMLAFSLSEGGQAVLSYVDDNNVLREKNFNAKDM